MAEAFVSERTISYGEAQYKVDRKNNWKILMWGWWPNGNRRPQYRWMPIPCDRVPKKVKGEVR